jgi:hypothetical protein
MLEFHDVLGRVEAQEAEDLFSPRWNFHPVAVGPDLASESCSTREAISAYGRLLEAPRAQPFEKRFCLDSFSRALSAASGSPKKLHALRRSLAWRLHPDRRAGALCDTQDALAQCNAAIDAALARCRVNSGE